MGERTMSAALAGANSKAGAPSLDDLAAKRRAMQEPEVSTFIKAGRGATESDPMLRPAVHAQPEVQLNTKIPEDLYQRARRAVFECQMSRTSPGTIQDLVSQALHAELKRLGF